jgi:hypothetical protein
MLHFPVFRLGYVVGSDPIGIETAEEIAQTVLNGDDRVRAAMLELIEDNPRCTLHSNWERSKTSTRRTPAIIIDFSTVDATIDDRRVEIRSGVTVCIEHKQSKCWTRINAMDKDVDRAEVDPLFDSFETVARAVNDRVLDMYRGFIRETLGKPLPLEKVYELNVRTASQSDDWIEDYFRKVFSEHDTDGDIDDLKAKLDQVLRTMNSELEVIPDPTEVIERDGEKIRQVAVIGARNPIYSEAVFPPHSGHAIYVLKYDRTSANFTGVGYDPYVDQGVRFQESLSHVASSNVAVEYGGLF